MKLLVTIATVIALQSIVSCSHEEWLEFKNKHGKNYANEAEENRRRAIFEKDLELVKKHNEKYRKGEVSFELGVNHMADLLPEEIPTGHVPAEKPPGLSFGIYVPNPLFIPPKEVDWRKKGAVTRVKHQLHCGSCWAFASVGAMEGAHFRKTGKLVELSEQDLVDCSWINQGCKGGNSMFAYEYVRAIGGIDTEWYYPYKGYQSKCRYNPLFSAMKVKKFLLVIPGNEDHLKHAVAELGPVSVAINVPPTLEFRWYRGGVFSSHFCSSQIIDLNHEVLIVGYGEDLLFGKYWIIKNSWGKKWGHKGYMKMKRGVNMCGVAMQATIPIAK